MENRAEYKAVTTDVAMSERFAGRVLTEFGRNTAGELRVTDYQRYLMQGYYIAINKALEKAEKDRIRRNENNKDRSYDNPLPYTWANIKLDALAMDVMHYARMGLDMLQSNHLAAAAYKDNKANKYDLVLLPGYNGIKYIAEKYAIEKPQAVTVELVFATDHFKPVKKSISNKVEAYEFEITNPFARGEVVGGFGYIEYADPLKNKLVMMSLSDILKRKPKKASSEFWGGKKHEWVDGKKTETDTEGWVLEMYYKTVVRATYSPKNIPLDPQKVDENYQHLRMMEMRYAEMDAQAEIAEHANTVLIDTVDAEVVEALPPPPEKVGKKREQVAKKREQEPERKVLPGPDF